MAKVLHLGGCRFDVLPHDPPLPELQPSGSVDAPYVYLGEGFVLPADGLTIAVRSPGAVHGWLTCRPADQENGRLFPTAAGPRSSSPTTSAWCWRPSPPGPSGGPDPRAHSANKPSTWVSGTARSISRRRRRPRTPG